MGWPASDGCLETDHDHAVSTREYQSDPLEHRRKQASGQMTLGQQQPVVSRVFHQAPACLGKAAAHWSTRPAVDALRQCQPPPQVSQVVSRGAQLQVDLIRPEPVTEQPRPMRCLFAFLDPRFGGAAPVVEPHDRSTGQAQIRHDEADPWE